MSSTCQNIMIQTINWLTRLDSMLCAVIWASHTHTKKDVRYFCPKELISMGPCNRHKEQGAWPKGISTTLGITGYYSGYYKGIKHYTVWYRSSVLKEFREVRDNCVSRAGLGDWNLNWLEGITMAERSRDSTDKGRECGLEDIKPRVLP